MFLRRFLLKVKGFSIIMIINNYVYRDLIRIYVKVIGLFRRRMRVFLKKDFGWVFFRGVSTFTLFIYLGFFFSILYN